MQSAYATNKRCLKEEACAYNNREPNDNKDQINYISKELEDDNNKPRHAIMPLLGPINYNISLLTTCPYNKYIRKAQLNYKANPTSVRFLLLNYRI